MNKFNDYQMHRMIYLLRLSFCIDQKNKYIPDTKVNDTPNNSTNNKISLEDYPIYDIKYSDTVGVGRKSSGEMAFALNNSSNYLELEYYDNVWNSSSDCIIKLEW